MTSQEKDTYFVAVKAFIKKDGKLLIMKDNFGDWDLPGGRIKTNEFDTSLDNVLKRKISEELGDKIQYTIKEPAVFMRHKRTEQSPGNPTVRIFAIGYEVNLNSGEIETSSRHTETLWVDLKSFLPEKYFTGGWLKGIQEYLTLS